MKSPSAIVVLTGAGISAKSGVPTFRDKGGIWSKVDYRDVATPQGFARDPVRVHEFYNERRRRIATYEPNNAHFALARLEHEFPGEFVLITQNVDALHEKAGSKNLIHMHGEHAKVLCGNCGDRREWQDELSTALVCPACEAAGHLRPDVVWFGETPYHMERISAALAACDLFISIGTSGNVYPAAGFVEQAKKQGAHTVELNLEPSAGRSHFAEARHGNATEIVTAYVEELLAKVDPGRTT